MKLNALLGACAMLMGYCRLTYSLTVMMLETTQAINLFLPVLITMLISYGTGLAFNVSLYTRALRFKQVPMLKNHVPKENTNLRAKVIMKEEPVTISIVAKVSDIAHVLKFGYKSYPVLNSSKQLVGMISHNFLIVLINQKAWYSKSMDSSQEDEGSKYFEANKDGL